MRIGLILAALAFAPLANPVAVGAQPAAPVEAAPEKPRPAPDRFALRRTVDEARTIATPEGVNLTEQVAMEDGDRQWISIRGRNRGNPVIVFIHGGPGAPMMPYTWAFQSGWEDYFTVVQWDQRGVGKNAATSDRAKLAPTMSLARTVDDAIAVIDHIRAKLGKDKVVVMGFSWGTMVGVHLAQKRPDLMHAYVGVGQAVLPAGEAILYTETIKAAKASGDTAAVKALEALGPYPAPDGSRPWSTALKVRGYARQYDGLWYGQKDVHLLWDMPFLATEYEDADIAELPKGEAWVQSTPIMKDVLGFDTGKLDPAFKVPVLIYMGRYDLFTPWLAAKQWFGGIRAPRKEFVTFDRSSHFIMLEEPGRFLVRMVSDILPLTEGAAQYDEAKRVQRVAKPEK